MIYCDNAATSLIKPPEVADAVTFALANLGAASRASHGASMAASREVYRTREVIAKMVGADDPTSVAFTSSATEALNLVIFGLIRSEDKVITTAAEHNSVLRPLYLSGCELDVVNCDEFGVIDLDHAERLVSQGGVKLLAVTHGSNVTGAVTDVYALRDICARHGVIMLLDVSQTLGVIPVIADMADILCFTGHKGLFGPQGVGGVVFNGELGTELGVRSLELGVRGSEFGIRIVKTGGSGSNTFDETQPCRMPDIFESGTMNVHGIYGLQMGARFVDEIGLERVTSHVAALTDRFLDGVLSLGRVTVYGGESGAEKIRLPIVSLNVEGFAAADVAAVLWDEHGIAVRAGFHCAPLMHRALGTVNSGAVRFSFSYFNTYDDVDRCVSALSSF